MTRHQGGNGDPSAVIDLVELLRTLCRVPGAAAAVLLGWARELGIAIEAPAADGDVVMSPCADPEPVGAAPDGAAACFRGNSYCA